MRARGIQIALVDCLDDEHLENICRAAVDLRLITGSSAFGMKLPAIWRERGLLAAQPVLTPPDRPVKANGAGCLIVAGSCSAATLRQNEWALEQGIEARHIHPPHILNGELDRAEIVAEARGALGAGRQYLLSTSGAAEDVREVQQWGAERGLSVPALGEAVASALAELVLEVIDGQAVGGLIVAGGETSGAVCRRLELGAMQVGRNIEPGVPLCYSLGRFQLPVVLKSGNFGSLDFYGKAIAAVTRGGE